MSYDLNYRESLWKAIGGHDRAAEVNRELVSLVDVVVGNEEDFQLALGFEVEGVDAALTALDRQAYAPDARPTWRRPIRTWPCSP